VLAPRAELATAEEQARVAADLDQLTEEFIATASHDLKAPVASDWEGARIEQGVANLVANAVKYSPPETTVQVRVVCRNADLPVSVVDRGIGISPEELARLFRRFHRRPQAIPSGLPGTGLGLYLSRGIIEAHGGRLWAASEDAGHGATFQFTLPRYASPAAQRQHEAERKERAR
jgi:signal transduction histidine kinase